jgi:hypothetical protein
MQELLFHPSRLIRRERYPAMFTLNQDQSEPASLFKDAFTWHLLEVPKQLMFQF